MRLKESLWGAPFPQSPQLPWLWCARCVWRRYGAGTKGWAAVGVCGSWEGPVCHHQQSGRLPTRPSSCAKQWGPGQAGGGDGGCIAALQLTELPAHGRGTWDRRHLRGSLSPTVAQQACTQTKRLERLLSCFGKNSINMKTRALPK